jgi:hypothetical protein
MNHWDKLLLDPRRYRLVFERIASKAGSNPRMLHSAAIHEELNLAWVLDRQKIITKNIIQLLKMGGYQLDKQKHSLVMTDKLRDFYIADWPERILIMVMAQIVSEKTNGFVPSNVYSFRKGRGQIHALNDLSAFLKGCVSKFPGVFILKRDITKYGDSIPQHTLLKMLAEKTAVHRSKIFFPLLQQALRCQYVSADGSEACLYRGIPSGSPLVPVLENFYLTPLDEKLLRLPNTFYGRFGDDFIVATPFEETARQAAETIDQEVSKLGLTIKPQKALNAFLTNRTAPTIMGFAGFAGKTNFEWLGAKVSANGQSSLKLVHTQVLWQTLSTEIRALLKRASLASPRAEDRIAIARAGLLTLVRQDSNFKLISHLYRFADEAWVRKFDADLTKVIVNNLRELWRVRKSDAWRSFRKMHVSSLFYLRFIKRKEKGGSVERPSKAA